MRDIVAGEAGHLRLGSIEPTASLRLPSLLVQFFQEHPKVRLTLEAGGTPSISQRIAAGHLDIAICSPPPANLDLTFEPLFVEHMAMLLPANHPLAEKDIIRVADLVDHRLLLTEPGCAYRAVIEQALFEHGTNPYAGIEIGSLAVLQRAVQSNLGVAIVPTRAASPSPTGTILRELSEINLVCQLASCREPVTAHRDKHCRPYWHPYAPIYRGKERESQTDPRPQRS